MTFIEFIAFVISLLALTYLNIRQKRQVRKNKDENAHEEEEEEQAQHLMRELHLTPQDVEAYEKLVEKSSEKKHPIASNPQQAQKKLLKPPPPPQLPQKKKKKSNLAEDYKLETRLETYKSGISNELWKIESKLDEIVEHEFDWSDQQAETNAYAIKKKNVEALQLFKDAKSKKSAIILHEIIAQPRAFRSYDAYRR